MKDDRHGDLVRLVAELRPADDAERIDKERILDLLATSEGPFDRHRFRPGHLTASALVLHPREPRIVVVHHRRLSAWLQPGGHAEDGEDDPFSIAVREVREETGLEARPMQPSLLDVDVHAIPAHGAEPAHEHFDLRILLAASSADLTPNAESHAVRWVTGAELDALGADHGLLRAAAKALASRGHRPAPRPAPEALTEGGQVPLHCTTTHGFENDDEERGDRPQAEGRTGSAR